MTNLNSEKSIKVAVVILNWNGKKMLTQFLPSVIAHTNPQINQIVVADNGSTDSSMQWLAETYPEIRRIEFSENYGFAEGYNRALSLIDSEYFVLLNSDVEVTPQWLEPLIEFLDQNPEVGAVQPKIKAFHNKNLFEYAGASGGFIDKYGFPFCRGRILGTLEPDLKQYDNPISIMWATGACLVIRADLYNLAGGLDAHFFAHMEEIDLCWRIKNMGKKLMVIPQSTVYHVGGGTLPNNSPHKLYLNYRNNLLLLYKNLPAEKFTKTMFVRWWLDMFSAIIYLLRGQYALFKQVFKAHKDYKQMKQMYKEHRKSMLLCNSPLVHSEVYGKSIVWQYFINGKKTFDQLNIEE